ncbi:30133_t:CDS:2, partial [Gigaspora margarita]
GERAGERATRVRDRERLRGRDWGDLDRLRGKGRGDLERLRGKDRGDLERLRGEDRGDRGDLERLRGEDRGDLERLRGGDLERLRGDRGDLERLRSGDREDLERLRGRDRGDLERPRPHTSDLMVEITPGNIINSRDDQQVSPHSKLTNTGAKSFCHVCICELAGECEPCDKLDLNGTPKNGSNLLDYDLVDELKDLKGQIL